MIETFERMIRGGISPIIVVGAVFCLAGCAARRLTRATILECVERAEADRRTCFQGCEGEFEEAFIGCYGRNACTDRCETRELACQAGPLHDLSLCGEATENPRSCQAQLHVDLRACAARPDRPACEEDGRRRALACWQACQRANGPALERCAETFRTCLDACVPR
jgi:hypothetical protein